MKIVPAERRPIGRCTEMIENDIMGGGEKKTVEGGKERHYRFGGGCNRNIIWQFGRFPGSAR
jgi:hypothetical protein